MSQTPTISDPIRDWFVATVGAIAEVRFAGWPHQAGDGWISRVWAITDTANGRYYLKQHRQPRKFQHELRFYQDWAILLERTPELVSSHHELGCLILSEVPGEVAESLAIESLRERSVHRQAGSFLQALHSLPIVDDDELQLDEALRMRLEHWCELGRDAMDAADLDWARSRFEGGFRTVKRVPAHHDFQPRNWIVNGTGTYFIDFEHTYLDHWLLDFVKLWSDAWVGRPDLEESFLEGYGYDLSEADCHELQRIGIIHGLGSVVWGVRHRSREYERHGRAVLSRLKLEINA